MISMWLFAFCGVYLFLFFCFCFSGLRFVAFCVSVSARERSVGRGNAALYRAFGAVSKIYYVSIERGLQG